MNEKMPIESKSMPVAIAEVLREAILDGKFHEGQALKQEEIASMFETSLIPVREAFRTLEGQGLVVFKANKGVFVTNLSADEMKELFEIRMLLEGGAIELAANNLAEIDMGAAEAILDQMDVEADGKRLSLLNWQFHSMLYKASGRKKLVELIAPLHVNVERYMRLYLVDMNYHFTSQSEHRAILEACRNRNGDEANRILRVHLSLASKHLTEFLINRKRGESNVD